MDRFHIVDAVTTAVPATLSLVEGVSRYTSPLGAMTSRSRSLTRAGMAAGFPGHPCTPWSLSMVPPGADDDPAFGRPVRWPVRVPSDRGTHSAVPESIRFARFIRPQPSSLLGTGAVSPTTIPSPGSVGLRCCLPCLGYRGCPCRPRNWISIAFTSAGEGVAPAWVSWYHCTATAAPPAACGPAWEVPP